VSFAGYILLGFVGLYALVDLLAYRRNTPTFFLYFSCPSYDIVPSFIEMVYYITR